MDTIILYLAFINILGFVSMGMDKAKAKAGAWRIPEKTLLTIALVGGGAGVWAGMNTFRHKTRHWYFKYGVPAITILELMAAGYFLGE